MAARIETEEKPQIVKVPLTKIDSVVEQLALPRVDYIKMDVEGYEFQALAGMERTLRDNAGYGQVELFSDRLDELKQLFAGVGYSFVHTEYIDHYFTNMPGLS